MPASAGAPSARGRRPVHNPLDAALATISSTADAPSGAPQSFLVWELRGALSATGASPERLEFDGGCRVERPSCESDGVDAAFIVAAGPGDIGAVVAGKALGTAPAADWSNSLRWLASVMEVEFAELRAARIALERECARSGLSACGHRLRVYSRARAWRRPGDAPRTEIVTGLRLRCEIVSAGGGVVIDELVPAPDLFSWISRPDLFAESARRQCEFHQQFSGAQTTRSLRSYRGPVVLASAAAGWLVHELGHAALEGAPGKLTNSGDVAVVDDPAAAPWPAGFTVDDAGQSASAVTLWNSAGACPDPPVGRRRASIRDAATPFLSFTRLIAGAESTIAAPPRDIPVIASAHAGRFDPISGLIILAVSDVWTSSSSGVQRGGDLTLTVAPEEVWSGLSPCGATPLPWQALARCSRLGSLIAVMVGAQTIALNSVHLASAEGAP